MKHDVESALILQKMKTKIIFFFLLVKGLFAQIPTNTWRSHLNYTHAKQVEIVGEVVYCSTINGFFLYQIKTNKFVILDKTYLQEGGIIKTFKYLKSTNALLISYEDGGIAYLNLHPDGFPKNLNYLDFLKESNIDNDSKFGFDVVSNGRNSYMATGFGILIFDDTEQTLLETVQNIGENGSKVAVLRLKISSDSLFAFSEDKKVRAISLDKKYNIQFYGNWKEINNSQVFFDSIEKYFDEDTFKINDFEIKSENSVWAVDEIKGLLHYNNGTIAAFNPNGLPEFNGYLTKNQNDLVFSGQKSYKFQDNKWTEYPLNLQFNKTQTDAFGNEWAVNGNQIQIKNGNVNYFLRFNNGLPGEALCFHIDLNNQVWIGTTNGIIVYQTTSTFVNRPTTPYYPIFGSQRLFVQESVNDISVDAGNRKWIATNRGLYLLSESGESQIAFYDKSNAPFMSNIILNLALDNSSGELFVQTSNAVFSLQTDSKEASVELDKLLVYPNPVRSTFEGVLTIENLEENSKIVIAELGGRIVFETVSNGGRATWNLKLKNGIAAPYGIYIIKCSNADESRTKFSKFSILR